MTRNAFRPAYLAVLLLGISVAVAQGITPPKVGTPVPAQASKPAAAGAIKEIDWDELIPPDARSKFMGAPPPAAHDYLGEGGMAAQQVMDFAVVGDDARIGAQLAGVFGFEVAQNDHALTAA